MKYFFTLLLVLATVSVLGFAAGRWSASFGTAAHAVAGKRSIPLFEPPPRVSMVTANAPADAGSKDIIIETPADGADVADALDVSGRSASRWTSVTATLTSASGSAVIATASGTFSEADAGFNRFSVSLPIAAKAPRGAATLDIAFGADSDPREEHVTRGVVIVAADTVAVKVFFQPAHSINDDPCVDVVPFERTVSSKASVLRDALAQLISGPTQDEHDSGGASTAIPRGVMIKSVALDADGVVHADFNSALERGVKDSCRINAIRNQIETTLKQFPEVRGVVISENGNSQGVLGQ